MALRLRFRNDYVFSYHYKPKSARYTFSSSTNILQFSRAMLII